MLESGGRDGLLFVASPRQISVSSLVGLPLLPVARVSGLNHLACWKQTNLEFAKVQGKDRRLEARATEEECSALRISHSDRYLIPLSQGIEEDCEGDLISLS